MEESKKKHIMRLIEDNPTITLSEIKKVTGIPLTTAWDCIQRIKEDYILKGKWIQMDSNGFKWIRIKKKEGERDGKSDE